MRRHANVVDRIRALDTPSIKTDLLGTSEGYPIHCVSLRRSKSERWILVIGGTHGDEPAGVEAALACLERGMEEESTSLNIAVIPCLNPHGYVHETRTTRAGIDLNWAFDQIHVPEIEIIHRFVDGRRFEAVIDFHEDWESPGYYLYELRRDVPAMGHEIVRAVEPVCPINTDPIIEGDPANAGVIHPDIDDGRLKDRGEAIPINLYKRHTNHLITSETPTARPMSERVQAHLNALAAVTAAHAPSGT